MKIMVCGLGHVGIVAAACLLRQGHAIVGIDRDGRVRDMIARGLSSVDEPATDELLAAGHSAGRLTVENGMSGLADADMAMICVGTPGTPNGGLDLSDVTTVACEIGEAVRTRSPNRAPLLIVFRSTMLPGSMTNVVCPQLPLLRASLLEHATTLPTIRSSSARGAPSPTISLRPGSLLASVLREPHGRSSI